MATKQDKRHCFIESNRPCTLKCKAAFQDKGKLECVILWSLTQSGWANMDQGLKVYNKLTNEPKGVRKGKGRMKKGKGI